MSKTVRTISEGNVKTVRMISVGNIKTLRTIPVRTYQNSKNDFSKEMSKQ
jgi:hypothetical protein